MADYGLDIIITLDIRGPTHYIIKGKDIFDEKEIDGLLVQLAETLNTNTLMVTNIKLEHAGMQTGSKIRMWYGVNKRKFILCV